MKNRLSRILFTLSIITSYSTGMFGASNPPKPPVDIENKDGYTPLMLAVKKDKISDVRRLIKAKADVNHTSANGLTPLICAAQSGHINNVKILLQHKADPNASEFLGNTPLMYAIAHNQVPLCKVLVESKADRELKNKYGDTVLDLARKSGKSDQLLRYLFNPDEQKDTYSQGSNDRALTYIQQNNIKELSRLIAENNIDVNAEYTDKTTPLFVAVHMDKPIIAKMLLEAQADPNHQNTFGDTALMLAASTNNTDIVELLLTHNANPHILKKDGFTALLIAAQEGHIDTIEIFLKHGLNINNQENRFKASMLMMAAEHGHLPLVNYLTMNNADISLVDSAGNNAFTIAVGANNLLIAQELFNAGIKTNKTFDIFMGNNNGDNALTIAIQTKNTTMVAFLLDTIKKSDQAPFNYYINLNIKKALTKAVANNYVDATRILLAKNPIHQKDAQLLYSHAIKNNFTQIAQLLKTYLPDEPEVPAHVDQKATCSGPGCDKEGPQKCVQCATVSYCSKECQTAHWKTGGHKAVCLSLGGKTSVASKKHEQNSQTVLTQASKPKETEDSSHMALLLAAQQEKKAQQEAEKSEKSKKLVALLRDFNPENTIERAHLKRHIQDGYRLHGEDIKLYKTEYEKAESLLFPTEHKIRSSGSAAAERADTLTLKPKQQKKHAHNKGKAAQQSDAQDAQLRAEKDTKLKQLALEQRHGVQPTRRGELPPSASEPYRPFSAYMGDRPSECGSDLSIEESNSFASAEHAVKMMPSSACAASESKDLTDNPYIVIPYGNGVLRLNRAHLFDGEAGNKGLHHDYERQLEKSNAFAYTHPKTNRFESENNGCYILDITKDGRTEIKSFFPAQWSAELLTARLINALQNNIQYLNGQEILGVITAYNPGEQVFNPIYFKAIVDRGVITTIFPVTHQRYLEIIEKQTKPKQEDQKEPFDSSDEQLAQQATEADMLARAIALSLADHNQEETKNEKKSPQLNRPEKKQQKKRKK